MGILNSSLWADTTTIDWGDETEAPDEVVVIAKAPPKFSTEEPDQYRRTRVLAKDAWGFSSVADLSARTNWAAQQFYDDNGRWPIATEMMNYEVFVSSVNALASGSIFLPPMFGTPDDMYFVNDSMTGPVAATPFTDRAQGKPNQIAIDGTLLMSDVEMFRNIERRPIEQWQEIALSFSPVRQPSSGGSGRSGGGGGGGVGRDDLVFDRNQLAEEATTRWRGMLLEEPDDDTLDSIVSGYITDANAFWMNEAGQLDYDTYVLDRIRATDRHTFLYDKKPEFQSESEYMSGFRQTVGQYGLNDRAALRETESGASMGVGLQGFGERIGRTWEARAANAGTYSQRFAASMAGSGLGRT